MGSLSPGLWVLVIILGTFVLGGIIIFGVVGLALEIHMRRHVRAMTTAQLRRSVLGEGESPRHFESYLDYVGRDRSSVRTFLTLIDREDLPALYREWPALEKDFLQGEREAGRRGRPFIMDGMYSYRTFVRELLRRSR